MPLYECVLIARQDISSSQVEGLVELFTGIVEENGGRVAKSEMWGLRNLQYRIKKNRKGHYALLNLDAPAAAVQEMERNMRINEDVIRYLTVRVNELEEGPSAVLQSRHGRDDRGRGGRGRHGDRGRDDRGRDDRGRDDRPKAKAGDDKAKGDKSKDDKSKDAKPKAKAADDTAKADKPQADTPKDDKPKVKSAAAAEEDEKENQA